MRHLTLIILTLLFAASAAAGESEKSLETVDGTSFNVYSAGPEDAKRGILLVHDWFGVTPFYHEAIKRLAEENYRVIAVDLYDGKSATTHDDAWALMSALDNGLATQKVDAALAHLTAGDVETVAAFGFSMGAPYALSAAIRHGDVVKATSLFYGETVNDPAQLAALGGPVLLVVGSKDGKAADAAATFSKAADEAGKFAEIYIYPGAHHAFAQPLFNAGETYDAIAAEAAWTLATDFLQRRLP